MVMGHTGIECNKVQRNLSMGCAGWVEEFLCPCYNPLRQ
jgi:hypothetical protein